MKKTLWILVAVALLPLAGCTEQSEAAQPDVTTSTEAATRLYVRSLPAGAEVRVDGQPRGPSPQLIDVPAGATKMTVEVALPGGESQRRVVEIAAGRITRVEFEFGDGSAAVAATTGRSGSTTTGGTRRTVVGAKATRAATDQDPVNRAKLAEARAKIAMIENALKIFELETDRLPTTAEGLKILWEPPARAEDAGNWIGPYILNEGPARSDLDPWGNPIEYRQPGRHNPGSFDIFSHGPDGQADTADDIGNWQSVPSVLGTAPTGARTGSGRRPVVTAEGTTRAADEVAVRAAVTKFVQAAVVDDQETMAGLLVPKYRRTTDHGEQMRIVIEAGMRPAELQQVVVRGDRALAASRLMRPSGQLTRSLLSALYTFVKQDGVWLIEDIDLEDAESLAAEVRRFEGDETATRATELGPDGGRGATTASVPPSQVADEATVRETITRFVKAAADEDRSAVDALLVLSIRETRDHGAQMREAMDSRMRPADIERVIIRGEKAMAISRSVLPSASFTTEMCFVYKLLKQDGAWLIADIDAEDARGTLNEIRRFADIETALALREVQTSGSRGIATGGTSTRRNPDGTTTGTRTASQPVGKTGTTSAGVSGLARINQARSQIAMVESALELYRLDVGSYPTTEQGVKALWQPPADAEAAADWQGPYVRPTGFALPDPWGNAIEYRQPGRHNPDGFDVFSPGLDGVADTADDIGNWRPSPEQAEVDKILRAYTEAVWSNMPAQIEANLEQDLEPLVHQVAAAAYGQYIQPNLDMLATHYLERLPKAPPIERSEWTVRTIEPSLATSQQKSLAQFILWQPVAAARSYFQESLLKELGAESFAKRVALQSMAPASMALVDGGLDRPVVLMTLGDELILPHLQRSASGVYECDRVEWLRDRRTPATKAVVVYSALLPADATPAARLLNSTATTVWGRLSPRLDTMEMNDIAKEASALTAELLRPRRDLLAEEAARRLARLPKAEPIDRSQWQPAHERPDGEPPLEAFLAEASKEQDLFPWAWDPVTMASQMRTVATSRVKGPEAMGIQSVIATVAGGYPDAALDADPDHPIIVTPMGNEMTIVRLRQSPDGSYAVEKFEWLRRKE